MTGIPTIDLEKIGRKINQLRIENNLAVKDLQKIFGFTTPQAIYKWQQGIALPSLNNLVVLSEIFNVPIEEILCITKK